MLLLGTALRVSLLVSEPLHQDEALYGYWGRLVSSGRDTMLATVPIDKPPFVPYLISASQLTFGVSEFAIRLPVLAASILSIALVYVLASRLYGNRAVALLASAVMALTAYPILLGATSFTDPVLVAWWLASCWCALVGRWGCAGIALGMAFASKQQAVALGPLVLGLGALGRWALEKRGRLVLGVTRFGLGLALVLAIVFAWDAVRFGGGAAASFWNQGIGSYGGLRMIWSSELAARLRDWLQLYGYGFPWEWLGLAFFGGMVVLIAVDLVHRRGSRDALADVLLFSFGTAYAFLHWLLAFPVWDRYLYPLVPIFGLLLARMSVVLAQSLQKRGLTIGFSNVAGKAHWAVYGAVLMALLASGLGAVHGSVPVGGDHGAYDGLAQVAEYLRSLPVGTVVYDRWLSWHYDFYLIGAYLYRAGFPSPVWLARDAAAFVGRHQRVVVVPSWESATRLERELRSHGLRMSPVFTTTRRDGSTSFVTYAIEAQEGLAP